MKLRINKPEISRELLLTTSLLFVLLIMLLLQG